MTIINKFKKFLQSETSTLILSLVLGSYFFYKLWIEQALYPEAYIICAFYGFQVLYWNLGKACTKIIVMMIQNIDKE